jgi:hypothetical protein
VHSHDLPEEGFTLMNLANAITYRPIAAADRHPQVPPLLRQAIEDMGGGASPQADRFDTTMSPSEVMVTARKAQPPIGRPGLWVG